MQFFELANSSVPNNRPGRKYFHTRLRDYYFTSKISKSLIHSESSERYVRHVLDYSIQMKLLNL